MIYFDNSATSLIKPYIVKKEVLNAIENLSANPGRSGHDLSLKVSQKIFETRENLKRFFHAENYDIAFTKNCTEAINLVLFSMLEKGDHVLCSCYEHNSVLRPLEQLKKQGVEVEILWCNLNDFSNEFESKIKPNTKLIVTTYISNVTGEICDVFSVAEKCKKHKIKYLIDAAQACGHIEINLKKIDADFLAFSGHKGLLSITGVGGLFYKNIYDLKPLIFGGTGVFSDLLNQDKIMLEDLEAGTIPSIPIISLNAGICFLIENFSKILIKEHILSEKMHKKLLKIKNLILYQQFNYSTVFLINIKNKDCGYVANELNERYKICVRSGLHCAPLIHKKLKTDGAVRISLNFNNTEEEIDYLCFALNKIANEK